MDLNELFEIMVENARVCNENFSYLVDQNHQMRKHIKKLYRRNSLLAVCVLTAGVIIVNYDKRVTKLESLMSEMN